MEVHQFKKRVSRMRHERSDRFLAAFSRIERRVRTIAAGKKEEGFAAWLSIAARKNPAVRQYKTDLQEFADLRNAIVHERGNGEPIAEPHQKTVERLEQIAGLLTQPPAVESLGTMKVTTFSPTDRIGKAAKAMLEDDFSQVPVYQDGKFCNLLTSETIARWIAHKFGSELDILEEETIEQVLQYREEDSVYEFVPRKTPIIEVLQLFDEITHKGKALDAVIVTQNGKENEKPLHILTVYDLPRLYRRVGLHSE
jgi:predicted transcriptional regulator